MKEKIKNIIRPFYKHLRTFYHAQKNDNILSTHAAPCDVLFQVENFLAGGLENVVLDLLSTFHKNNLNVALLILGHAGEAAQKASASGIPVFIQNYSDAQYKKFLRHLSPKLVFAHYSIHGASLCKQAGIPFLQVIHNAYIWFNETQKQDFLHSAEYTTLFIAVSDWVKEYSIKKLALPENKIIVIPNGIDINRFSHPSLPDRALKLRHEKGFSGNDILFTSIASISSQKNSFGLVQAFHAALPACPKAKLLMLGPVYDKDIYNRICQYIQKNNLVDKIIYLGKSTEPELYYAMSDIFIHAAFFEGGQLSLLEALASNLPVVSTDIGFCRHFKNHKGIYLAPPPIDLLNYSGAPEKMVMPDGYTSVFAKYISMAYMKKIRPDLPTDLLKKMDKDVSYTAYIKLITELISNNQAIRTQHYDTWVTHI